ncbi:hypothetical protein BDW71DRAFT_195570 [Aspergillus fruticulosus]
MSTPSRRTRQGCWTCKTRRRRCDRTRPMCRACAERGLPCEGYEVRLRWGTGIASRGRFTGADAPVAASIPPRAQGRRRDRSRDRRRQFQVADRSSERGSGSGALVRENTGFELDPLPSESWKSVDDAGLFDDFLSSGINILHSTTVHDGENPLKMRLPALCQQSEALYQICITLQVSIRTDLKPRFFEYFDAALNKFRSELAQSETYLEDGTLTAGLLLSHGAERPRNQISAFRAHLLEVMGVVDLPTFAIGRQNPYLGFWRQYCRNRSTIDSSGEYDVEVVSGLPRSLIDIFSSINAGATEEDFWNWPGARGSFLQCQLWEAYRLAGTLDQGQKRPTLPSAAVILTRLLSCVDAIYRASLEPEAKDILTINAIPYPVFVAGLQTNILEKEPSLKEYIRKILIVTAEGPFWNKQYRLLLNLLEEYWTYPSGTVNIHEIARARQIEPGLF